MMPLMTTSRQARRPRRHGPADPQMGRRQAAAPADAAALLSVRASAATSSRSSAAAPCSSTATTTGLLDGCDVHLSDINADVIGCYRMVRDDVEAVIDALRRRSKPGHRAGWHAAFLRGPRRAVQRAAARRPRVGRPGERLHAGARGDADLPEPDGLQRPVPRSTRAADSTSRSGRYARVTICDAPNLRRLSAALAPARADRRGQAVRGGAGRRPARRFRLPRSALCAGQPDGALHVLHRRRGSAPRSRRGCSRRSSGSPGSARRSC